jgi:hypothetical protein
MEGSENRRPRSGVYNYGTGLLYFDLLGRVRRGNATGVHRILMERPEGVDSARFGVVLDFKQVGYHAPNLGAAC